MKYSILAIALLALTGCDKPLDPSLPLHYPTAEYLVVSPYGSEPIKVLEYMPAGSISTRCVVLVPAYLVSNRANSSISCYKTDTEESH